MEKIVCVPMCVCVCVYLYLLQIHFKRNDLEKTQSVVYHIDLFSLECDHFDMTWEASLQELSFYTMNRALGSPLQLFQYGYAHELRKKNGAT